MLIKRSIYKRVLLFSRMCIALAAWAIIGCATSGTIERPPEEVGPGEIEAIKVSSPDGTKTVVEIISNKSAPYTTFKLIDPPRLVLDVRGVPRSDLPQKIKVNDGNVVDIHVEMGKTQSMTARVVVNLAREVDHKIADKDNVITLTLVPEMLVTGPPQKQQPKMTMQPREAEGAKEAEFKAVEPRIFFKSRPISLNQVLGVDFTMLAHGKSRLTVTTDKRVLYSLKRETPMTVVLTLEETTIPALLLRHLDSTHFEGALDNVKPIFYSKDNRLSLFISLRETVPFHVDQLESAIHIDFGPTAIRPPEKKIIPVKLAELRNSPEFTYKNRHPLVKESNKIPGLRRVRYTGTPMTMNFVNADVTNILRLIGEVSKLNIIWGPEVKGAVSMRLEKVPWDQALDLVLANNDLAMRRQGKVIWITTRKHMAEIEAEEKKKREDAEAEVEAKIKKKLEAQKEAKKLEPLVAEYFPLDFARADQIKGHIEAVKTERGTVSIDERTNTIIVKDIASTIEEAAIIVKRFDTPVKQIVIEARIVDATTNFARDLGVEWDTAEWQARNRAGVPFGLPTDATTYTDTGGHLYGGSFSTNSPTDWLSNIGLSFGKYTGSGVGVLTLNARLALAETEGKVKIISAPKVVASNGEEAVISRGDIIYKDVVTADRIDTKELEAVLSLTVTPTVSFNDFVTMAIQVTDDKAVSVNQKLEKRIKTKLMVESGQTIVIGGIYKEDRSNTESGIPFLRETPILGWLFKAQRKTLEKTELLIFLTPTVVQTAREKI